MSLNIKNEETHRLVRELAERTGQSQTSAVEDAVRRRLLELDRESRGRSVYDNLMAIAAEAAERLTPEERTLDYDALLYDEDGLPKW